MTTSPPFYFIFLCYFIIQWLQWEESYLFKILFSKAYNI